MLAAQCRTNAGYGFVKPTQVQHYRMRFVRTYIADTLIRITGYDLFHRSILGVFYRLLSYLEIADLTVFNSFENRKSNG
jgi:hypothetical protein